METLCLKVNYQILLINHIQYLEKITVVALIKIGDVNLLELFHGPTLAFKDIAMQLLGNFYEYYLKKNNKQY